MKLTVNGYAMSLDAEVSVGDLLRQRDPESRVAVAVNGEFVPRARYDDVILQDGDDVEIVAPMQGG